MSEGESRSDDDFHASVRTAIGRMTNSDDDIDAAWKAVVCRVRRARRRRRVRSVTALTLLVGLSVGISLRLARVGGGGETRTVTHDRINQAERVTSAIDWLPTTPRTPTTPDSNRPPPPTRIPAPEAVTTSNGPRATALAATLKNLPEFGPLQIQVANDLDYGGGKVETRLLFQGPSGGLVKVYGFRLTEPEPVALFGTARKLLLHNEYVAALVGDGGLGTASQLFLVAPDGSVINIISDPIGPRGLIYQAPALSAEDLERVGGELASQQAR